MHKVKNIFAAALILAAALWLVIFEFYIEKEMSDALSSAVEDEEKPNPHYTFPAKDYPIRPEDYTQFKREPRIQFTWRHPLHEKETVWSIGLHGEDLREAIDADWLYMEAGDSLTYVGPEEWSTRRSPDNRYIVALMTTDRAFHYSTQLRLYDLKTRAMTVVVVFDGDSPGSTAWSPDSKALLFYADETMMEYRVDGMVLIERTHARAAQHRIANMYLFTYIKDGIRILDDAGDGLGFIPYERRPDPWNTDYLDYLTVSPEAELAALVRRKETYVASVNDTDKPVFILPRRVGTVQFLDAGKLLFIENDYFKTMEIPSEEVNELFEFNMAADIKEFRTINN